jgi:protein CpxP
MNFITKNKWLAVAIVILILLNITTLTVLWWTKKGNQQEERPPQGGAIAFLVKELKLDSLQQQQLLVFRDEHRSATQEIRKKNREAKEVFFSLLEKEGIADAEIDEAATVSARYDAELAKITFDHFKKIRSICTAEQQKRFDEIIQEVLRMLAGPQGPPPPRDGHPRGPHPDGPPPHERPEPEK